MSRASSTLVGSMVLCLIVLGLCVYLTAQSLMGTAVLGCGSGSGCAKVLASEWSRIGPVPVSALGLGLYAMVLFSLFHRAVSGVPSKLGDAVLILAIPAILIAVVWFITIQVLFIQALCVYCMASHVVGLFLVLFLIALLHERRRSRATLPLVLGILGGASLIAANVFIPAQIDAVRATNLFVDQDGDTVLEDGQRHVSVFGGQLQFVLQDVPHIGDPAAEQVVVVLFDYACPYCKTLHDMLGQAIGHDPSRFVLVPIPLSIHESVNPFISSDNARFKDSLDLARLSLVVYEIDPQAWQAFDRWLFASDDPDAFPRSFAEARQHAGTLVDPAVLEETLDHPLVTSLHEQVARHISLLGQVPEDKRFIPVTTTPGAPEHLTTRFDDIQVLYDLLESAKTSE